MNLNINDKEAGKFVSELWEKITDTGFNSMSKNDFYDYVLYLFNNHAPEHFLDTASNRDNSLLLRVTEQKIKSSKQNIFLKYYGEQEKANILPDFFTKIAENKINLQFSNNEYSFVIEDLNIRYCLEGIMKNTMGVAFDYHQNREIVKISVKDFYLLFGNIANILYSNNGDMEKTIAKIGQMEKDENKKQLYNAIKNGVINVVEKFIPLPVSAVAEVATKLIEGIKK